MSSFEGMVRAAAPRRAEGGRVGVLGGLAAALVEGAARRTRSNPRGLPMDDASRRARAESLGFDLDDVRYHGTSADADFRAFRQKDRGVWTTDNPAEASSYARQNDSMGVGRNQASRVVPVVSRARQVERISAEAEDAIRTAPGFSGYQRAQADAFRRARHGGADAIDMGGGVRVELDARNLRVPHATFDPERAGEADLLAGAAGLGLGAGAAFEGLVREEAGYSEGGRVGRLARGLQDRLRGVLAERPVGVEVDGPTVAAWALRDGRLRNAFDGNPGGRDAEYLGTRRLVERRLFGLPDEAEAAERPLYGALRSARPEEATSLPAPPAGQWVSAGYGDHLFLLTPEARDRSRFTLGDSFTAPRAYRLGAEEPDLEEALRLRPGTFSMLGTDGRRGYWDSWAQRAEQAGLPPGEVGLLPTQAQYIETQTFGGVPIEDVAALLTPERTSDVVRGLARDRGIPVHSHGEVARDLDLQRALRLRAAAMGAAGAGGAGAGVAEEGYSEGGRVGLLRRGFGALARAAEDGGGGGRGAGRVPMTAEEIEGLPLLDPVERLALPQEDRRARSRAARQWVEENLRGNRYASSGLEGAEVVVPRDFGRKIMNAPDEVLRGLPAVPSVIEGGARLGPMAPPDPPEDAVRGYWYLGARVPMGEAVEPWRVVVREDADGTRRAYTTGRLQMVRQSSTPGGQTAEGLVGPGFQGEPQRAGDMGLGADAVKQDPEGGGYSEGGRVGLLLRGLRAFHGSPHRFDRFDISKIGTGEGNQAYGHGLYFAEDEGVAQQYRRALSRLSGDDGLLVDQEPITALLSRAGGDAAWRRAIDEAAQEGAAAWRIGSGPGLGEDIAGRLRQRARDVVDVAGRPFRLAERAGRFPGGDDGRRWAEQDRDFARQLAEGLESLAGRSLDYRAPGASYEVRLGVDAEDLLDLDAPLRDQPRVAAGIEGLRDRYARRAEMEPRSEAEEAWLDAQRGFLAHREEALDRALIGGGHGFDVVQSLGRSLGPATASGLLRQAGVPGSRYWDGMSRRAQDGTRNFVMFDDEPIEIIRRYAQGGMVGGLQAPVGNLPGPADEVAVSQNAAARGLGQAAQMWRAAEAALGGGSAFSG